jgi:hypothetical protein
MAEGIFAYKAVFLCTKDEKGTKECVGIVAVVPGNLCLFEPLVGLAGLASLDEELEGLEEDEI